MNNVDLNMPRSLSEQDSPDFEDTFIDELQQEIGKIPLHMYAGEGGWPDDDSIEINIDRIDRGDKRTRRWTIAVSVKFTEVLPTGCADIKREESGLAQFDVVLDFLNESAYAEVLSNDE